MLLDRHLKRNDEQREVSVNDWPSIYSAENGYENIDNMKESTYFSCLKIISESIAKCKFQLKQDTTKGETILYDHYLYDMLALRPNEYMSAVDCFKTFITLSVHYGISGLLINRNSRGKVLGLYPVKLTNCTIDDAGLIKGTKNNKILWDWQSANNEIGSVFDKDVVVLRDFTVDGIKGKAVRNVAGNTLDTSIKSQDYLNKLFSNGLTNKLAVQLVSDIKDENELKKIQEKFNRIYSSTGKIFTIPSGFNLTQLNLSLADAQFVELRKLSKEEIATTLQVPLSKLGIVRDNAKSEEQDNIKFLSDCLQVKITQIEQELDYKLLSANDRKQGMKIRANQGIMLRLDAKTQAEVISTYVRNGIYDLDFAREIIGVPKFGGDPIVTLPSGQVLLKDLLDGKVSYQRGMRVGDTDGDT
ncbi:phage portal protein [Niameybacter massiliensis]|uniref:Phage portal protein n=1 Tax=Holtiella tumoricola TaxID=3018743 RepID=A0AA42DN82_9FIRM|nr:phage portal protein [Holtiella tumoricola]MDA3732115.1 phage portal protein [Holtiella tumoricola]